MTRSPFPRFIVRLLTLAVLVAAGTYLLVYLYRWEWNRALISGLFFLAAEVAYVGSSLRAEIAGLRDRIEALGVGNAPGVPRPRAAPGARDARPARPFAWLRETTTGQTNVFVPVLLGAGVILSAVAFVVERVAGAVATASVDRTAAGRLAALEPPAHGLLEAAPEPTPPEAARPGGRTGVTALAVRLAALVVLVLAIGAAIGLLADATQSRPTPVAPGTSTVVELSIDQRRPRPASEAAEALAVACHGTLRSGSEITNVVALGDDRVQLEVTPALSELRRRRLFGCLQDATLDLVQARVVGWTSTPATTTAGPVDTAGAA
jgi:hypothetical protein